MKLILSFLVVLYGTIAYAQTAEEFFSEGKLKYESKAYAEAETLFDKSIELNALNDDVYIFRGNAKSNLSNDKVRWMITQKQLN